MNYEAISVLDIFKIGVGPSSSHTLGPWRAALLFLKSIKSVEALSQVEYIRILLYGSLAKTGRGHGTDIAVMLGLCGYDPVTIDVASINSKMDYISRNKKLFLDNEAEIDFDASNDIEFLTAKALPYHPNALTFLATLKNDCCTCETYYSVGGGFVVKHGERNTNKPEIKLAYPIANPNDLLSHCDKTGLNISSLVMANELSWRSENLTRQLVLKIYDTMKACIYRGCHTEGILPGGLQVKRRAFDLNKKLIGNKKYSGHDGWIEAIKSTGNDFQNILDWVSCFALAVNEENAAFGRIVTAPTNGAAGVIPAVLQYFILFCNGNEDEKIFNFLLTASEIGSIFKKGATISAAMGGCQAEIGVSCAMAAGALTESLGGTPNHALMAAEIAMEHHLGLTCDPVGGLVQVPCIERNTMGAIKAITATQLALQSEPKDAKVSLDKVIKTMWSTALDMNIKYKETSEGGLAVNIPASLSEC